MAVAGESKKSESDRRRNSVVARAAGLRAYGDETRKRCREGQAAPQESRKAWKGSRRRLMQLSSHGKSLGVAVREGWGLREKTVAVEGGGNGDG